LKNRIQEPEGKEGPEPGRWVRVVMNGSFGGYDTLQNKVFECAFVLKISSENWIKDGFD